MTKLLDINNFLNEFLLINDINDNSWNGLQYEGATEVTKIGFAVDACKESFQKAIDAHCQLLITHHGLFWKGADPSLNAWNKSRITILSQGNLSLYTAHLPLDRHLDIGNNAQLLKLIGAERTSEFMLIEGKNVGWIGQFSPPKPFEEIIASMNTQLNTNVKTLEFGKKQVASIAVCSGGGGYDGFYQALQAGVDVYLTGDAIDITQTAKDAGLNVIFAGHNATETVGVKSLATILEEKFQVDTVFIDLPTGL